VEFPAPMSWQTKKGKIKHEKAMRKQGKEKK
jgi:hypothetical protein